MKVGEFLRMVIFFSNMSQREVAEQIGITPGNLSNIIKGKRTINTEIAKALKSVLKVPAIVWLTYQNHDDLTK